MRCIGNVSLAGLSAILIGMATTARATNHTVQVVDFRFIPDTVIVQPGDSVTWVWASTFSHSSTSVPPSSKNWDSGLKTSGTFRIQITGADGPGPWPYHCSIHLGMTGLIKLNPPPCCTGTTGNVDCDPSNGVDISDMSTLIDNLYISFTPLCCDAAANIDGSPGVDISDLSALIDHLYINFSPLAPCQ